MGAVPISLGRVILSVTMKGWRRGSLKLLGTSRRKQTTFSDFPQDSLVIDVSSFNSVAFIL